VTVPTREQFRDEARRGLSSVCEPARTGSEWGRGSDSVAIFENWDAEQEREFTAAGCAWERRRYDAGWGALSWPAEYGGRGLPAHYEEIYREVESGFDVPVRTELFSVTQHLVAPTVATWGTQEQRDRLIRPLLRTDLLACQLFSEPGAGSDLASVSTKAVRSGDGWRISGQKVWTSVARVAHVGEALCRTDPDAPKHAGLTVFLVPLDAPGVTVRPIRQMTGGASFNEVFLDDVLVKDSDRLGPVGEGWGVALSTLASERLGSGALGLTGVGRALSLARYGPTPVDGAQADALTSLFIRATAQRVTASRVRAALVAGVEPGPEASVGKLFATETMRMTSDIVASLLGPSLVADTGEWGTFCWTEHLLGAPGYRIAGGSDEIQRTILAQRVLGLPR
jgi:alkylation response protein AidB-like acyl-CoA dehydrogenase